LVVIAINLCFAFLTPKIVGATDAHIPDISFGYTQVQLYAWLEAFGESGRQVYFYTTLLLDTLYPVVYAFLFAFLLVGVRARSWVYLPFLIAFVDMSENLCMLYLTAQYPIQYPNVVIWASLSTQLKWLLLALWAVVMAFQGLRLLLIGRSPN
jgi:hypothetical protein